MGFSAGGTLAVLASSEELAREFGRDQRFAAHLGIYPHCWVHRDVLAGKNKHLKPAIFRRGTGKPVLLMAAENDGYDDSDGCPKFLQQLPPQVCANYSVTVYSGATFGWDSRISSAHYDSGGRKGKGGIVTIFADADTAAKSRVDAVAFFSKSLETQ